MKISTLLFVCALALSAVAGYYSIVGLAAIFSAAFWPVVIMACILEISKLVCASWLYQKWHEANNFIKTYLTISVLILMFITSLGIFGFLSRAHVDQQLGSKEVILKIEQIDGQIALSKDTIDRYKTQLAQLDRSINIQLDANRATQALAARQRQVAERDQIRQKLDQEQEKLQQFETSKIELKQKISVLETEVGPIKYVAEFFTSNSKVDLERAVRWMIIILVVVFDPLAVLMLIAANMTLMKERHKEQDQLTKNTTVPVAASEPVKEHTLPSDRLIGNLQLQYDFAQRTLMYFNGEKWIPTELGIITPKSNVDKETVDSIINESLTRWIDKNQNPTIDYERLNSTVKAAMDSWLTTASTSQHSKLDEQTKQSSMISDITETEVQSNVYVDTASAVLAERIQGSANNPDSDLATAKPAPVEKIIEKPLSWI